MQAGSELSGGLGALRPPVVEVEGVRWLDFELCPTAGTTLDLVDTWFDGTRCMQGKWPHTAIDLNWTARATVVVIDYEIGFPIWRRN